ncbi:MAG: chemotaxis protein CheW [Pseudomonadota bacterium]
MLFLLFQLGDNRYALAAREVVVVLPLVNVVWLPGLPAAIAGVCNYRGSHVPVVDLCQVLLGRPAVRRLHTRIVVVNYRAEDGGARPLGLIAERATETLQREAGDFAPSGVSGEHLGSVVADAKGLTQRVEVNGLLPAPVRELLFRNAVQPP